MAVVSLTLINADTDRPVVGFDPIAPGASINLAVLPTRNLNIRANASPPNVGSVRFDLDGAPYSTEESAPFAMAGNSGEDYGPWTPSAGAHTLTVTPFALPSASGAAGTPLTLVFLVIDPAPGETAVSFQDGVSPSPAYAGTRDTEVCELKTDRTAGTAKKIEADGGLDDAGKDRYALLRWDVSAIPAGSVVRSAWITFHVVGGGSRRAYSLYELKREWVEKEATWIHAAGGKPWEMPGAKGPQDRGEAAGTLPASKDGPSTFPLDPAVVQGWVNRPAANFGLLLANSDSSDGIQVASREHDAVLERPKLTIVWGRPGGAVDLDATGGVIPWLVLGPFGNRKDSSGISEHDLLKTESAHVPVPGAEVATREGAKVRWTPCSAPEGKLLFYDLEGFASLAGTKSPAIAFAACWLDVETPADVRLRINADHGYRVWVDHKRAAGEPGGHGMNREPQVVRLNLTRGTHLVMVKVASTGGSFGFRLRVTTASGDKAQGVRAWNRPPGTPARKVLLAENFDQGRGKFDSGEVSDGGVNGSKALSFPKSAGIGNVFPSPVTPTLTVRVKVKPLFDLQILEVMIMSGKLKKNCWFHLRGLKKGEWNQVEFKVADVRQGYLMDGPSLEGDTAEHLTLYFDDDLAGARVLIDDFEIIE